jgi:hypothetical protein
MIVRTCPVEEANLELGIIVVDGLKRRAIIKEGIPRHGLARLGIAIGRGQPKIRRGGIESCAKEDAARGKNSVVRPGRVRVLMMNRTCKKSAGCKDAYCLSSERAKGVMPAFVPFPASRRKSR